MIRIYWNWFVQATGRNPLPTASENESLASVAMSQNHLPSSVAAFSLAANSRNSFLFMNISIDIPVMFIAVKGRSIISYPF